MTVPLSTLLCLLIAFYGAGMDVNNSTIGGGLGGYGLYDDDYEYDWDDWDDWDWDDDHNDFVWQDRNDIGNTIETYYCSIVVESAEVVEAYGTITPYSGYKLVDVVITTVNTSDGDTYMTSDEYIIRWGENSRDYDWMWYDEDDAEGLAPYMDFADPGDVFTYHYLYEVPVDTDAACIEYYCPGDGVYYWLFFPLDGGEL